MTKQTPQTIDEYIAALSEDKQAALERLRKIIRAAAPGAKEFISYNLPAFRLEGKTFLWFGASANHCALYGVSGTHEDEFKDYDRSGKGTLRFQAAKPLPAALVRKLVRTRIAKVAHATQTKENPMAVRDSTTLQTQTPVADRHLCQIVLTIASAARVHQRARGIRDIRCRVLMFTFQECASAF